MADTPESLVHQPSVIASLAESLPSDTSPELEIVGFLVGDEP
jgi:hypothetical protein